jgi:hypothetical protein
LVELPFPTAIHIFPFDATPYPIEIEELGEANFECPNIDTRSLLVIILPLYSSPTNAHCVPFHAIPLD